MAGVSPRHAEEVVARLTGDSLVLLHTGTGGYFTLDPVGARVWELCDGARSVDDIVRVMHDEFEAPLELLHADVDGLLAELAGERLLAEPSS